MTRRVGPAVRLSALALATGTVVVAASTGAHAAPAVAPTLTYAGNTGSSVVSLALNLPGGSALGSALASAPTLGGLISPAGTISLSLLNQIGSLQHDATGKTPDLATSTSTFAGGTIGTLLTNLSKQTAGLLLNQSITSTLQNPVATSAPLLGAITSNLPAQVKGLVDLQVPGLKVTSAATPLLATNGNSVIAGVDLGKIADALPAGTLTALESALSTAVTSVQGGTSTVSGTLGSVIGQITGPLSGTLTGTPLAGVGTALTQDSADLQATITALSNELPGILTNIENGSIVSLKGLTTTHSVTTVGNEQVSTVANKLASLSILGGLVNVDGFANALTTEAGGTAGTSKVIAQPNLAKVSLGTNNELTIVLGQISTVQGLIAKLGNDTLSGLGLPASQLTSLTSALSALTGGLTTLTDALNNALGAAGVTIKQDAVTQNEVAPDGSSAKGALAGLQVIVDPLSKLPTGALPLAQKGNAVAAPAAASAPLLDISVGALDASSAAGVAPAAVEASNNTAAPTAKLAYTGSDLPLTAGVASLLIAGGAYAARRRRSTLSRDDA